MATRGRSARAKGNSYELAVKNEHIEMGFGEVFTSRNESKRMDDKGVDLVGLPYHIQCKAVEKLSPSMHKILAGMPSDQVRAVFHKRNRLGTVVCLNKDDWYRILKHLNKTKFFKK
ncbi:MAG: hypothetical protein EBR82_46865 [Caulobacteraceae bacterium]|jgi:hypothetical protein|nr:hypothetical protein [Caulobacteraceae bacterium]